MSNTLRICLYMSAEGPAENSQISTWSREKNNFRIIDEKPFGKSWVLIVI